MQIFLLHKQPILNLRFKSLNGRVSLDLKMMGNLKGKQTKEPKKSTGMETILKSKIIIQMEN